VPDDWVAYIRNPFGRVRVNTFVRPTRLRTNCRCRCAAYYRYLRRFVLISYWICGTFIRYVRRFLLFVVACYFRRAFHNRVENVQKTAATITIREPGNISTRFPSAVRSVDERRSNRVDRIFGRPFSPFEPDGIPVSRSVQCVLAFFILRKNNCVYVRVTRV